MYHLLVAVLQPYPLLLLLLWLAWGNLWRRRCETRRRLLLLLAPLLLLTLCSLPAVAHVVLGTLEWQYRPLREVPEDAEAIVVLGGGVRLTEAAPSHVEQTPDSLYRCLLALDLHRQKKDLPLLVTGGKAVADSPEPPVAEAMADFLRHLGLDERLLLVESASRTTYENAVESAGLLERRHVRKIVLVTEAKHMCRSERCFRKQGLDVVPAPCAYQAEYFPWHALAFIPDPKAVADCEAVCHEWLGVVWYWLHGRI